MPFKRKVFAAALTLGLAACQRAPEATYGVDTTINDAAPEQAAAETPPEIAPAMSVEQPAELYDQAVDEPRAGTYPEQELAGDEEEEVETPAYSLARGPQGNPAAYFSVDNYPLGALRAGAQGRVLTQLTVGADGRVSNCIVTESSGNQELDGTTCRIALGRVRFSPARDERGEPTEGTYMMPVRWTLPTD